VFSLSLQFLFVGKPRDERTRESTETVNNMVCRATKLVFFIIMFWHTRILAFSTRAAFSGKNLLIRQLSSSRSIDGRIKFVHRQAAALSATTDDSDGSSNDTNNEPASSSNISNRDDQLVSALSGNGHLKVTACTIRNLVNDVMIQQCLTATPADALARSMASCLLLSNGMQEEQTFQLTLDCDGPIRTVVCIATGAGTVRGYVGNPQLTNMHISEALGTKGRVQVVKMHPEWPRPYNGITAMEHGDVDRDIGIYLAESEQRSCALAASSVYKGILCTAAGAYLVEQLPGCTDETTSTVEANLAQLVKDASDSNSGKEAPLPAGLLEQGCTPYNICERILQGLDMQIQTTTTPKLECHCSEDRLFRAVRLLPRSEVDAILREEKCIEARCDFCGKVYRMDAEQVNAKLDAATGDPSKDEDFYESNQ